DHTPTQRADGGIGTHGELLLSEAIQGPRSFLRTGLPAPTMVSSRLATNPRSGTPRSGYRGSDLVPWGLSGPISYGLGPVAFRQHVTQSGPELRASIAAQKSPHRHQQQPIFWCRHGPEVISFYRCGPLLGR